MPRARQASPRPRTDSDSCHATRGFSGLPKLRQFVSPSGSAPTQARFAAHSRTTSTVPVYGSQATLLPLPSIDTASAPSPPSWSSDSTAASAVSGRRTVRAPTIGSYCSNAQRLLATLGERSSASSASAAGASWLSVRFGARYTGTRGTSGRRSYCGNSSTSAHVLERLEKAAVEELQAALEQLLLLERVADLHAGPLVLILAELRARQHRGAADPVAPG